MKSTTSRLVLPVLASALFTCLTSQATQTTRMQVMPRANAAAHPMLVMQKSANDEVATQAAIDSRLSRFANANAANPKAQAALDGAAAEVRGNPEAYIGADGSLNQQAMSAVLARHFDSAGPVVVPSPVQGGKDTYPNLGSMADGDIMALAFIVMMEAAKSAQEDLKSVMDGVKTINKQKQSLRESTNAADKQKLDSLSEMGEMESLRLQMAMDRKSKLMSTLSNLLKKESETSSNIIQNIK